MSGTQPGQEIPLVFECRGENLLGIIHQPSSPARYGIITVVAGGPQYRAGMGRGLVSMGRALSARGIAVMRFDHRGLGDSSGDFLGFEHLDNDLQAAVAAFRAHVPEVEKIVLWGGCDAASGIMMHACKVPDVVSIIMGNPFVSTSETQAAVARQHYLKRLGEWSFWRKLLRFEYNLFDYVGAAVSRVRAKLSKRTGKSGSKPENKAAAIARSAGAAERDTSFIDKMLAGLQSFDGPALFVMSGQSLVSKEFDELLARSSAWRAAYGRPGNQRVDLPNADQAFSSQDAKARVNEAVTGWLQRLDQSG